MSVVLLTDDAVLCIRALRDQIERGEAPPTLFDEARIEILNTLEADK